MKKNFEKVVLKDREKRRRISTIVKHLKKLVINKDQLTIVILDDVVFYLKKNNLKYSKREIYDAFKLIPKTEYPSDYKNEEINRWSRDGQNGSVFTKKTARLKPTLAPQEVFHAYKVVDYAQKLTGSRILSNQHLV